MIGLGNNKLDLSGKRFGNLVVIGETGKTDKNGQKILLARDIETGNLFETITARFLNGRATGFKNSKKAKENGKKYGKINSKKMNEKTIREGINISALIRPPQKNNETGYTGIIYEPRKIKWLVTLKIAKTKFFQETFLSFEDAVKAKFKAEERYLIPVFTEEEKKIFLKNNPRTIVKNRFVDKWQKVIDEREKFFLKRKISRLEDAKGVYFDKGKQKYSATITINGKQKYLGYFNTEQEAIEARQKAVEEQIKKLKQELEML